jgi:hypothetical protein
MPRVAAIAADCGSVPKWPTGADCKSAVLRLRWFESSPAHQTRQKIKEKVRATDFAFSLYLLPST